MKLQANKKGFTILFAVLVSGALLIMALGIANISYREVALSSSARTAGHAFFAADSGVECALYWDGKGAFPDTGLVALQDVICLGQTVLAASDISVNDADADGYNEYSFEISDSGPPARCVIVSINKNYVDSSGNSYTRIESRGYNVECANISGNPRAVERSIEVLLD